VEGKGIRAVARELGLPVASVHKLARRVDEAARGGPGGHFVSVALEASSRGGAIPRSSSWRAASLRTSGCESESDDFKRGMARSSLLARRPRAPTALSRTNQ
jgi:hypothetical protein